MYHIIVNPTSSSGKGMDAWREIKDILDRKNVAYKVYVLRKPGEATMVAGKLTAGRNMALNETAAMDQSKEVVRGNEEDINILVIGGDGTLNEVLNGIQKFDHTTYRVFRQDPEMISLEICIWKRMWNVQLRICLKIRRKLRLIMEK